MADDLVQDTLERAWRNSQSLRDEARMLGWLVTILRRCWIDACRKRRDVLPLAVVPEDAAQADGRAGWHALTVDDFRRAIDRLDEPYRSIAILHDIDQLSNNDIARKLAIPYATVATRLHRAHKQLKQLLQGGLTSAEAG